MYIYIVAVIIALVLIGILFFALRSTVKRIDYNTKKYFLDKLQDYDYLIDEKQKILKELNEKIENNEHLLAQGTKEIKVNTNEDKQKYYNESKIPIYEDEDLFKKYKNIKEKFTFDEEELIKKFISENIVEENNSEYNILVDLRKKFTRTKIYEIIKFRAKEQNDYINKLLTLEQKKIINKYINLNRFKINDFIVKLDNLIEKKDPTVYVYTGEKGKDYNYISPIIQTKYDDSINEGIKINYKGALYDYSL